MTIENASAAASASASKPGPQRVVGALDARRSFPSRPRPAPGRGASAKHDQAAGQRAHQSYGRHRERHLICLRSPFSPRTAVSSAAIRCSNCSRRCCDARLTAGRVALSSGFTPAGVGSPPERREAASIGAAAAAAYARRINPKNLTKPGSAVTFPLLRCPASCRGTRSLPRIACRFRRTRAPAGRKSPAGAGLRKETDATAGRGGNRPAWSEDGRSRPRPPDNPGQSFDLLAPGRR